MITNNNSINDISSLISMGFPDIQAREALQASGGNLDLALEFLLSGQGGSVSLSSSNAPSQTITTNASAISPPHVVHCGMSQYDCMSPEKKGKSACTCIALYGAHHFLSSVDREQENVVTPEFLQNVILNGVEIYSNHQKQQESLNNKGNVEHLSVDEVVVSTPLFNDNLVLIGDVRQGMLSLSGGANNNNEEPLGLRGLLNVCRSDSNAKADKWMAAVITKTPETILLLLPPARDEGSSEKEQPIRKYIIVDSHPRPHLPTVAGAEGSFAIVHGSMDGLVDSLKSIFPATDLGPDVGDVMAMMYNTFDLYAFQKK